MSDLLSADQIATQHKVLPDWSIDGAFLCRDFRFKDFTQAFAFMTHIALICEKQDHHPNWENTWNIVKIRLTSHDVGGLSLRDFRLAQSIDQALKVRMS